MDDEAAPTGGVAGMFRSLQRWQVSAGMAGPVEDDAVLLQLDGIISAGMAGPVEDDAVLLLLGGIISAGMAGPVYGVAWATNGRSAIHPAWKVKHRLPCANHGRARCATRAGHIIGMMM